MADLLTRAEVDEHIADLQKLRSQMLATTRAGIKCQTLYAPEEVGRRNSYRDVCYEECNASQQTCQAAS